MTPSDLIRSAVQILTIVVTASIGFGRMEGKIEVLQHDLYTVQQQQAKMAESLNHVRERVF